MNDLNQRLTTLADEMADTDYAALRQRVDTTARRLGYRRAAITSVAALALAGVAAVGGVQMLPQSNQAPQPGGSATTTAPPTPSTSAPATPPSPPATQARPPAATTPDHVPGRLVYVRVGAEIEVITVTDGVTKTTSFGARVLGDRLATVSPDGTMVALVHPTKDLTEYPGDLVVVRPGGARKVVARDVAWGGGVAPVWTPDSRRLLVSITEMRDGAAGAPRIGYVDATSGGFTGQDLYKDFPHYLTWSANGSFRAHAEDRTIMVARADGTVVRRFSVAGQPECDRECPYAVQSISDDGRYVATAIGNTDPTRVIGATIVLDTTNGRRVAIATSVTGIREIFFRADNSLVVQTDDKLRLVTLDGKVTATLDRPHPTNQANLDRYTDR
ncbi:TolB-like translocation protein [Phytohabitans suffuscus]|uniref:Uncharacterized protein n=1 Tax=Phytohabitans suffuscus TaxID=624315 RepID=A0A6F8YDV0_9ACTN|nr:hypothetical protein [Phytohabitans suffuscus]BCB84203.1 hypothetical protein Psuf_015160 [Phytohabitans suffuscus]